MASDRQYKPGDESIAFIEKEEKGLSCPLAHQDQRQLLFLFLSLSLTHTLEKIPMTSDRPGDESIAFIEKEEKGLSCPLAHQDQR